MGLEGTIMPTIVWNQTDGKWGLKNLFLKKIKLQTYNILKHVGLERERTIKWK